MMHVIGCESVRDRLEAFQDGELALQDQIAIQGHLRDCVTCALEAGDLAELSDRVRQASAAVSDHADHGLGRMPALVIDRLRVERQLSFMAQMRARFEDMHLVWAGTGATVATIVCLIASLGVLQAAHRERPDSLAGIISYLANPGSNANPMRMDARMMLPRPLAAALFPVADQDAIFAMAGVVTREGRVQDLQMLAAKHAHTLHVKPEVVLAMLEAASRARFSPAQAGGAPIAVSMVWLVEMTTVRGQNDYNLFLGPPQWPEHRPTPARGKPAGATTPAKTRPAAEEASA